MIKRDILCEIYNNLLTDEQARILVEQAYEDFHYGKLKLDPREYACMSYQELTVLSLHGLYFTDIAKFRYEGWPNKCMLCNKDIIFGSGGTGWWTYRAKLIRGKVIKNVLVCAKCSSLLAAASMKKRALTLKKIYKKIINKRKFIRKIK